MKKEYKHHQYPEMRQEEGGYWYIYYGRRARVSLKTKDKRIATQVFAVKKQEQRDEKIRALTPLTEKPFADFIEEYTKWRAKEEKSAKTVRMDNLALRLLLEHTGNKPMNLISNKDVDEFHGWIMQPRMVKTPTGKDKLMKGCAKTSVNVYIRHLKVAFRRAMRWGYITKNPYSEVSQYTEDEKEVQFLTEKQITEILLPAFKPQDEDFKSMILAYLYTGGRGSEVCNMHRKDITIDEETDRQFILFPKTKTHRARFVPLSKGMIEILEHLPEKGFLFPRWRNVETVSKKLKRYLRKVGLGHMWLHGLRHTNISLLTMKGVPDEAIMRNSGQTQKSTLKRYQHLSPGYLLEVADKLHFEEKKQSVAIVQKKKK